MKVLTASNSLDIAVGSGTISAEGKSNMDNYNLLYGGETRENYLGYHVYQSGHINYLVNLGEFKLTHYFGIQQHVFYRDSDRQEKEVPFNFPQDQDLALLR